LVFYAGKKSRVGWVGTSIIKVLGAKGLSPEEIQEQYFNLGRCRHDKKLFEKFTSYLEDLRRAA
jgi:hypothetical protein